MTKKMVIGVSMLLALLALGVMTASADVGTLSIERSDDRLSATATWTPSAGAESQHFFYLGKLLLGEKDVGGKGFHLESLEQFILAGDADSLDISGLDPRREYVYLVARADRDSEGKWVLSEWSFTGLPSSTSVATDREALVALYNATDGDNWRENANWLTGAPLEDWYGVKTDSDGRVVELSLWLNKLEGELPSELGNLAALERLNLPLNTLSGDIPSELGSALQPGRTNPPGEPAYRGNSGRVGREKLYS